MISSHLDYITPPVDLPESASLSRLSLRTNNFQTALLYC